MAGKKYDVLALGELLIDFTEMEIRCLRQIPAARPAMCLHC